VQYARRQAIDLVELAIDLIASGEAAPNAALFVAGNRIDLAGLATEVGLYESKWPSPWITQSTVEHRIERLQQVLEVLRDTSQRVHLPHLEWDAGDGRPRASAVPLGRDYWSWLERADNSDPVYSSRDPHIDLMMRKRGQVLQTWRCSCGAEWRAWADDPTQPNHECSASLTRGARLA